MEFILSNLTNPIVIWIIGTIIALVIEYVIMAKFDEERIRKIIRLSEKAVDEFDLGTADEYLDVIFNMLDDEPVDTEKIQREIKRELDKLGEK